MSVAGVRNMFSPEPARTEVLRWSPLHLAVAVAVCLLQAVASIWQVELAPLMSHYPMYSETFASVEQFERTSGAPPIYHYQVEFPDGVVEDATGAFEQLRLGVLRDAYLALVEGRPQAETADEVVAFAARRLEEHYRRPIRRITLLIDQQAFDWQTGRFVWKAIGLPVYTFEVGVPTPLRQQVPS